MPQKSIYLLAILEAPLAHIQPVYASPDELFRVEGRVPGLDEQRAEDYLQYIGARGWLLRRLERRGRRRCGAH